MSETNKDEGKVTAREKDRKRKKEIKRERDRENEYEKESELKMNEFGRERSNSGFNWFEWLIRGAPLGENETQLLTFLVGPFELNAAALNVKLLLGVKS